MVNYNPNLTTEAVLDELEKTKWKRVGHNLLKDWRLYLLLVPVLAFIILFKYLPYVGILQGFKTDTATGVMNDEWAGIFYLRQLFDTSTSRGAEFWTAFRNTFVNSMYGLIFGFPIPIFLALLFSEIKNPVYRSFLQVCSYLPKFISTVVVTTIITLWCYEGTSDGNFAPGMLAQMLINMGALEPGKGVLYVPKFFRPIYQISGIWEGAGYGSIVYFAAVMAISPTNYEAAKIDGANKMQQIKYVTLPGMAPTLTIMLILRIGDILNIGYEKVLLLYRTDTYETADVISTFVYRQQQGNQASLGVAADLFNSLISMCLVLGANAISRRISDTSLF